MRPVDVASLRRSQGLGQRPMPVLRAASRVLRLEDVVVDEPDQTGQSRAEAEHGSDLTETHAATNRATASCRGAHGSFE